TYLACAPKKLEEALQAIRSVHERLASKGPGAKELERARQFYLGTRAMDLQGDTALASMLSRRRLYGLPYESENEVRKTLNSISPQQIRDACRKYFVEPYTVTAAVS